MVPQFSPTLRAYLTLLFCGLVLMLSIYRSPFASAQGQVQVAAANPATAEQGTINLNVKVNGKGFKNGAKAKWFITGTTDTGGVTVNSTTFVSSTEVTANITIADTAVVGNFDIQVLNSDGRGGKGTELFGVTPKGGGNASCPPLQPAPTSDTKCYGMSAGCLDSTFAGVGYTQLMVGTGATTGQAGAALVQGDGKIVIGARAGFPSTSSDFAVIRFNVDGSLDTSFGDVDPFNAGLRRGYTVTSLSTGFDNLLALALQPDGKIIANGTRGVDTGTRGESHNVVVRYTSDGVLDTMFGSSGIVVVGDGSAKSNVALQEDGKIVVVDGARVTRLTPNGAFDSTFGIGGQITVNASGSKRGLTSLSWGIAIQRVPAMTGEERIVVTGYTGSGEPSVWTLMRFRPNGAADTSFGINGVVKTTFSGLGDRALDVAIDSSNRIVTAGVISLNGPCGAYVADYAVVRYAENGTVDGSFGGGKQIVDVYGGRDFDASLAIQTDGRIVIGGSSDSSDGRVNHIAFVRFNADGTRDSTFGLLGNGIVTLDAYGFDTLAYGNLALSPVDGKIVIAGATTLAAPSPFSILVARYLP